MQVIKLTYDSDRNTWKGNSDFQVTVVSTPVPYGENTMMTTIHFDKPVTLQKVDNDEVIAEAIIPVGNWTASARGGQFNEERHIIGGKTNFSAILTEGQSNPIFTLLPNELVIGQRAEVVWTTAHVAV